MCFSLGFTHIYYRHATIDIIITDTGTILDLLFIKRLDILAHIVEIALDPQECIVHEFVVF